MTGIATAVRCVRLKSMYQSTPVHIGGGRPVCGPRRRVTFLARPLVHGPLVPACLANGYRLRGIPSTLPTIPLLAQPPTMRTPSGAQPRREGLDPSASESLHADGAPPAAGAS